MKILSDITIPGTLAPILILRLKCRFAVTYSVAFVVTPTYDQVKNVALEMKRLKPDVILTGNQYGACQHFGTSYSPRFDSQPYLHSSLHLTSHYLVSLSVIRTNMPSLPVRALKEIDYVPKALIMPLCIDVPTVKEDLGVRHIPIPTLAFHSETLIKNPN